MEDIREWALVPYRVQKAVGKELWKGLKGINCTVAHRRYHRFSTSEEESGRSGFAEKSCTKCGRKFWYDEGFSVSG